LSIIDAGLKRLFKREISIIQSSSEFFSYLALFDDPATAAFQMEDLLNRVLQEKEGALPPMKRKIDWKSFEEDFRFYVDTVYLLTARVRVTDP